VFCGGGPEPGGEDGPQPCGLTHRSGIGPPPLRRRQLLSYKRPRGPDRYARISSVSPARLLFRIASAPAAQACNQWPVLMTTASWVGARRAHGSWVGRLELWPAFYGVAWSRLGWRADLRFLGTGCDRWCPLHPLSAGPACTHCVPAGCGPVRSQAPPVVGASRRRRFDGYHSAGGRCSRLGGEDRAWPPVGASTPTSPPAMVARIVANESGTAIPL
jgi:hypothetical protein